MNLQIEISNLKELQAKLSSAANSSVSKAITLAIKKSLLAIQDYARDNHRFKSSTGNIERSIQTRMKSADEGEVFLNSALTMTEDGRSYAEILHQGVSHGWDIEPRFKKSLRWESNGNFVFAKKVHHDPIKADPFIYNAAKARRDEINDIFDREIIASLREVGISI